MQNSVELQGQPKNKPLFFENEGKANVSKCILKVGTDYIPIVAFGDQADILKNKEIGETIKVDATLKSGKHEKNGSTVFTLDVICQSVR